MPSLNDWKSVNNEPKILHYQMTTIMPLLYQSGYMTIKGYDKMSKLYELALPNQEIKVGLFGTVCFRIIWSVTPPRVGLM